INDVILGTEYIAIRLKIQTKSSHKTHKSQLLRLDFVNLKSWIAIVGVYLSPACGGGKITSTQYFLVIKVFFGGVLKG
ncbi:hypothetical protein, partial [Ruminococcus sp.]|uniref:hypothetical protein n=1 Tax=Ruminococcus sp. TaxID=41978 RepID=UPI00260054DC